MPSTKKRNHIIRVAGLPAFAAVQPIGVVSTSRMWFDRKVGARVDAHQRARILRSAGARITVRNLTEDVDSMALVRRQAVRLRLGADRQERIGNGEIAR